MADINVALAAKPIHCAIYQAHGKDPEKEWIDNRMSQLTMRQRNKWSIRKIRNYLLDNFCNPTYVEEKLRTIYWTRYWNSLQRRC